MNYATDSDLLHWEPQLFKDSSIPSQTLLTGSGDLAGDDFTISAGSFSTAGVAAGHVIYLGGSLDGCFPITGVNSDTAIEISVLYDDVIENAVPVGAAAGVAFTIQTAAPQIALVSDMIRRVLGVADPDQVLNAGVLRRTTALGALQMLYNATAAIAIDGNLLAAKAVMYERLYKRSLRSAQVEIDTNGDGKADVIRCPGVPRLVRA